jgi:hypothetical protein
VESILPALLNMNPQVKAIIAGEDIHHPLLAGFLSQGFSGAVIRPYTIDDLRAVLGQLPP